MTQTAVAWIALVACSVAAACGVAGESPSIAHEARTVRGWTVLVHLDLLETDAVATTERALELLAAQLDEIERAVPAAAVAKLRDVPLHFSPEYEGVPPRAEYHPDPGWLREHGRDPAMARAVEFTNVRIFTAETERMPNFVLHELAHAYHHRVLPDSFGNADVKAAHARAIASGLYDAVERRNGSGKPVKTERAYALTTPQEFFAETTEAFFSRNDFFPYTKADLARHDPETTTMLARLWGVAAEPAAGARPNIVILYADDMGYGDLGADNPASKIPTPHLDRLAAEGMRFTDAHSSSGICSPSRYALLTGRHHWRDFHGIVDSLGPSVFKPGQLTLPAMLRDQGYATACVGKWHLGWDWNAIRRPRTPPKSLEHGDFDWTKPIPDGPLAHGFDTYFGDDVIDFPPYAWIENDRVVEAPDATLDKPAGRPKEGEWECRAGPARSDWDFYRVLPTLTRRAEDFVRSRQGNPQPFLLYFPLPSPHAPIIPNDEFDGRSRAGPFGDFVAQTDDACGRVLAALRETGLDANTIVVFTADNGAEQYAYARDAAFDHWSSAPFRGIKRDLYEGGHHVPFLLRWPGVTKPGSVSHALVSQVDLMATLAAGVGYDLPADAAADSHDLLPWLTGGVAEPPRTTIVHNTNPNRYAIRHGDWLLVDGETGVMEPKKRSAPAAWNEKHSYPPEDGQPVEFYDLRKDVGQRHNLAAAHPEQVAELRGLLKQTRETERSAPAAASDACRKPNVVFFLCDDLGTGDLGSLGSKDIRTPNIDGLFARGTRLSRHWSGSAVCAPSRCVLMTGKHPGHAVVRSNRQAKPEGQAPMPAGTVTLAKLFQDSGYATGGFGKWGLGAPGSWSDPIACGFDDFFGYNCQREAHSYYPDHLWSGRERVPLDGKSYSADLIAERQLAFIKANAGRPFFLYVPTTVPHLALQVPDDEPSLAHYEEHFGDESPYLGGRGYVPCRRPLATYAAMITRMDREVGRIVGLLDELKLADDTIFVFSSDNGAARPGTGGIDTARLASNGMLRDWKGSPYEGGLRVPTVAVWPGTIPAGKSIDAPTGFEDWLPTLLDLAGLRGAIPAGLDGMSLAPALRGEAEPPPDRVLYRELTEGQWQAAVDGRWKAIRRAAGRMEPRQAAPTELYDLAADPSESKDLAVAHPDVVARLEAILDREHVADAAWPMPFAAARATPAPRE